METILKRWKVLAQKYKRDAYKIQEQALEVLISLPTQEIIDLELGNKNILNQILITFKDHS